MDKTGSTNVTLRGDVDALVQKISASVQKVKTNSNDFDIANECIGIIKEISDNPKANAFALMSCVDALIEIAQVNPDNHKIADECIAAVEGIFANPKASDFSLKYCGDTLGQIKKVKTNPNNSEIVNIYRDLETKSVTLESKKPETFVGRLETTRSIETEKAEPSEYQRG